MALSSLWIFYGKMDCLEFIDIELWDGRVATDLRLVICFWALVFFLSEARPILDYRKLEVLVFTFLAVLNIELLWVTDEFKPLCDIWLAWAILEDMAIF